MPLSHSMPCTQLDVVHWRPNSALRTLAVPFRRHLW